MGLKPRRCLCCVPVHHAVMIIGAIHTFRLGTNLFFAELQQALFEICTVFAFLAMVWKDQKLTRKTYFASYCFYLLAINIAELYLWKYPTDEETESKQLYFTTWCEENLEVYGYESMAVCKQRFESRMMRDELIYLAV